MSKQIQIQGAFASTVIDLDAAGARQTLISRSSSFPARPEVKYFCKFWVTMVFEQLEGGTHTQTHSAEKFSNSFQRVSLDYVLGFEAALLNKVK